MVVATKRRSRKREMQPEIVVSPLEELVATAETIRKTSEKGQKTPKNGPKPKKSKVLWSDDELEKVSNEVVKLVVANPSTSFGVLCNRAQQAHLPADRQRCINGAGSYANILKRVKWKLEALELDASRMLEFKRQAAEKPIPLTKDQILKELTDDDVMRHFKDRVLVNLSPADLLETFSIEDLIHASPVADVAALAMKRFVSEHFSQQTLLTTILDRLLVSQAVSEPKVNTAFVRPATLNGNGKAHPRIMVVGALPDQQTKISNTFNGRATFDFRKSRHLKLRELPSAIDGAVVWRTYCSHEITNTVRQHLAVIEKPEAMVVVTGGFSQVIHALDQFITTLHH